MRSGVIASDASKIRRVQSPSGGQRAGAAWSRRSLPRRPGVSAAACDRVWTRFRKRALVVLLQIHAGVERGDLVGVAVEWEGRPPTELADPALGVLSPARMTDRGIDVRVEA